jgi:hypothetical protein
MKQIDRLLYLALEDCDRHGQLQSKQSGWFAIVSNARGLLPVGDLNRRPWGVGEVHNADQLVERPLACVLRTLEHDPLSRDRDLAAIDDGGLLGPLHEVALRLANPETDAFGHRNGETGRTPRPMPGSPPWLEQSRSRHVVHEALTMSRYQCPRIVQPWPPVRKVEQIGDGGPQLRLGMRPLLGLSFGSTLTPEHRGRGPAFPEIRN